MSQTTLPMEPIRVDDLFEAWGTDDVRLRGHRIGIEHIVVRYREGYSAEEIAGAYPGLDLRTVYTLIAYYLNNRLVIDAYMRALEVNAQAAKDEWNRTRTAASRRVEAILRERAQDEYQA
jgi:uncharacterized protein (DUF433 family)